ncbi:26451_t:CDS:2, partial [Dentiscutata erythropus]
TVSNQQSLHDFINKKTPLPISKQDKITNRCTVHMIQLALGDRFDVEEVSNLINKAKTLNSYINGKDKYCEKLCQLQAELNPQHQLSCHLRDFYPKATSQVVKACCSKINQSMLSRWFEPSYHSLIAAFLDPRFKKMNYITPIKKRETIAHLYTLFDTQERPSSIQEPQTSNTGLSSFFASFYDDDYVAPNETKNISSVEKEVTLYDNLPKIPKYHITDEEYQNKSPVWKSFEALENEPKAKYKYCKKVLSHKKGYGTSHLRRHLKSCLKYQSSVSNGA